MREKINESNTQQQQPQQGQQQQEPPQNLNNVLSTQVEITEEIQPPSSVETTDEFSAMGDSTADVDFYQKQLEKEKDRRKRQKRQRFIGYVRSRKLKRKMKGAKAAAAAVAANNSVLNPISIDAMDGTSIPKVDLPYKKYRSELLEIMSQNQILEHRTRVNRRAAQPFNYNVEATHPRNKTNKSQIGTVKQEQPSRMKISTARTRMLQIPREIRSNPELEVSTSIHGRNKRRINYSEELVDEAFMYEQILHDKQHQQEKRKRCYTKGAPATKNDSMAAAASVIESGNLDSRLRLLEQRNEISITPLKSRLITKDQHSDVKMPKPVKSEPLFNITSSVSVHIKPRQSASSSIQISNITSLHANRDSPSNKRQKITCKCCSKTFADVKQLAVHQLVHLTVPLYKIDAKRILHPKLRRVSAYRKLTKFKMAIFVDFWFYIQIHTYS